MLTDTSLLPLATVQLSRSDFVGSNWLDGSGRDYVACISWNGWCEAMTSHDWQIQLIGSTDGAPLA